MNDMCASTSNMCNGETRVPARAKLPSWVRTPSPVAPTEVQPCVEVKCELPPDKPASPPPEVAYRPRPAQPPRRLQPSGPPPATILAGPKRDPFASVAVQSPAAPPRGPIPNYLIPATGEPTPIHVTPLTERERQLDAKAVAVACMAAVEGKFAPWPFH